MLKKLLSISTLLFLNLNAADIETGEMKLAPRTGKISLFGTTYATQINAEEAKEKGHYSALFTENVCVLAHPVIGGVATFVLTQLKQRVFLCTKTDASGFSQCYSEAIEEESFDPSKVILQSGAITLQNLLDAKIELNPDSDLALIYLAFENGDISPLSFLSIARDVDDSSINEGFIVSYADVTYLGEPILPTNERNLVRSLSTHRFQKNREELNSYVRGYLAQDTVDSSLIDTGMCPVFPCTHDDFTNAQILGGSANFMYPLLEDERLMSTLAIGTSGSPLVVTQDGQPRLIGLLHYARILTRIFDEGNDQIDPKNITNAAYENGFLYLPPHRRWIEDTIARLTE